ncbi:MULTISPECIES: branched-chain amino acid ABC transporter permease [Maritimibacter]|jgi:branched-chain amino acid transport system permease protein|uniref:Branched-chain amino acid ABC transporter permease n=1 Tax=Maritimibacter harenae TaxID=2606218 RepID=A0A845M1W4_9RHOB|nr:MULTISPECIES: branched-chain amino acid ABC transporter permease [Maritimibacter]MAM61391.1 branched-chain amino acid ABC transporter permease [Maritimibacter sp.]MBL6430287.1 branched-chain amino acid ABC transporter permease [Maritimibacter sp.]MZR11707.1 branched-chain amino acid ABC transporter permease [Maritimibacter harenae]|tara:strand:- start:3179 stop:4051 length:873 start_codon:yes stop_codon:yes gene_type:complete
MLSLIASILIDGISYGLVLFMVSVGLTVTLGLMRFVNLAHGTFAMVGGYAAATFVTALGLPYVLALILAAAVAGIIAFGLEIALVRRVYARPELDQVLLTIGLVFMGIALSGMIFGNSLVPIRLPEFLRGSTDLGFRSMPTQRFVPLVLGLLSLAGIWLLFERTRFGVKLRATVDNPRAAGELGINTRRVYAAAFAIGAALAGLGGVAGAELLPVEPYYPLKYLVLFLAVVAVGGPGNMAGSFVAAILLGTVETAGKYLAPEFATIALYALMLIVLSWRPEGLFQRSSKT